MRKYIFIVGLLFPYALFAQSISGKVTNENNEPLNGASVFWANTTIGTITDINGEFELTTKDVSSKILIANYVGHTSDTLEIANQTFVVFKLNESQDLMKSL